jgi:hypothetical protein
MKVALLDDCSDQLGCHARSNVFALQANENLLIILKLPGSIPEQTRRAAGKTA